MYRGCTGNIDFPECDSQATNTEGSYTLLHGLRRRGVGYGGGFPLVFISSQQMLEELPALVGDSLSFYQRAQWGLAGCQGVYSMLLVLRGSLLLHTYITRACRNTRFFITTSP